MGNAVVGNPPVGNAVVGDCNAIVGNSPAGQLAIVQLDPVGNAIVPRKIHSRFWNPDLQTSIVKLARSEKSG